MRMYVFKILLKFIQINLSIAVAYSIVYTCSLELLKFRLDDSFTSYNIKRIHPSSCVLPIDLTLVNENEYLLGVNRVLTMIQSNIRSGYRSVTGDVTKQPQAYRRLPSFHDAPSFYHFRQRLYTDRAFFFQINQQQS